MVGSGFRLLIICQRPDGLASCVKYRDSAGSTHATEVAAFSSSSSNLSRASCNYSCYSVHSGHGCNTNALNGNALAFLPGLH
eukprot:scaffold1464_cov86-Skeletonema_dohrnii-CCMP3373.AAC.1